MNRKMVSIEHATDIAGSTVRAAPVREERGRRVIAELRRAGGFLDVGSLADRLRVSHMTIRRDLAALEQAGEVRRTRGGAYLPSASARWIEPPFVQRRSVRADAKRAIARRAVEEVHPGQIIGIDVGSTTLELCPHLAEVADLTIVTSSLPVAGALAGTLDVYIPGGRIRPRELSVVGASARDGISRFHLDTVFIGAAGLDESGISDYSVEDSEIKRIMIGNADRVVVLCDSSKLGRRSAVAVCGLHEVDVLVTDEPPSASTSAALSSHGVDVWLPRGSRAPGNPAAKWMTPDRRAKSSSEHKRGTIDDPGI